MITPIDLPLRGHILYLHAGDTYFSTRRFWVLYSSILVFILLHLLMHHLGGLFDDLIQEDDSSLSCAHALNKSVVDMLKRFRPGELEKLKNLEELLDVKILLRGYDIYHLVELVLFISFNGTSNIPSEIYRCPICERIVSAK